MKITALILLAGATVYGADMTIELQNPPATGMVEVLFFDSPDAFDRLSEPAQSFRIPATGQRVYRIAGITPGNYALMVHHDENSNEQVDKNFIGIHNG